MSARLPLILWAIVAAGQPTARAQEVIATMAATADGELKASMAELASVREKIDAEKLPLSQRLSRAEAALIDAKRRAEDAARQRDTKNLDLTNARALVKVKQQEAAYVRSLLDEYFRNFEQSVTVAEAPLYRASLQRAIQAPENVNAAPVERLEAQLGFVRETVDRLFRARGGVAFEGQAVDTSGNVSKGTFVVVGPVAVFGSKDGKAAGVVTKRKPSNEPAVVPLPQADLTRAIKKLAAEGAGFLPVDPTLGGALNRLLHDNSVTYYFKKGGPIMWPILICFIAALGVVIERLLFLQTERHRRNAKAVAAFFDQVAQGATEAAARIAHNSKDYIARALGYALEHRGVSFDDALHKAISIEMHRYQRGTVVLDTIITAAPLLGLLGTVTGMMGSFGLLGENELGAPTAITGGIAEALIATACGLGIAIICLFPYNYLNRCCEVARHELEDAGSHLSLLLKRRAEDTGVALAGQVAAGK